MHIFGPVPSRRLGLSLGVDLLNCKTCNLNCVYCELGRTIKTVSDRAVFVKTEDLLKELKVFFEKGGKADYVTFSGSGEPTLALNLGEAIDAVKKEFGVKTALITNATLFSDADVRLQSGKADVVLPSFDAATEEAFLKVNRPHPSLNLNIMIEGLIKFSEEYKGIILLEILLVKDVNDNEKELRAIKAVIDKMKRVEKIQINTIVRTRAESWAQPADEHGLNMALKIFGDKAEIISSYKGGKIDTVDTVKNAVMQAVRLRPVALSELIAVINAPEARVRAAVDELLRDKEAREESLGSEIFITGVKN